MSSSSLEGHTLKSHNSNMQYKLKKLLGSGGFAGVWCAASGAGECAVKLFEGAGAHVCDEAAARREADVLRVAGIYLQTLAPYFHEVAWGSIVDKEENEDFDGHDCREGRHPRYLLLAMDLLQGHSVENFLDSWTGSGNPMSERVCRTVFGDSSAALFYLHSAGIIHRDVKCDNLMISKEARCMLVDFGAALVVEAGEAAGRLDPKVTHELARLGQPLERAGTSRYMAPEIARCDLTGLATYDYKVDVWSLGMSMYEFITGRSPLQKLSIFPLHATPTEQIWHLILTMPQPRLPTDCICQSLRAAVEQCLIPNATDRICSEDLCMLEFIQPSVDDRTAVLDCFRGVLPW